MILPVRKVNNLCQVDFGFDVLVTGVATQGRDDEDEWVTQYTLRHALRAARWRDYQENGTVKVSTAILRYASQPPRSVAA